MIDIQVTEAIHIGGIIEQGYGNIAISERGSGNIICSRAKEGPVKVYFAKFSWE